MSQEKDRAGAAGGGSLFGPLLSVLLVQVGLLSLILSLGSAYAPQPRMVPLDSLALPGASVRLGVRLHTEPPGLLSPDVSEREILLVSGKDRPREREVVAESGVAITDAKGAAWFEIRAPEVPGIHEFLATPKRPDEFSVAPPTASVLLQVIPPARSLLLVLLPGALDADLWLESPAPGVVSRLSPAAEALRDLSRHLDIVYLVAPRWRNALGLRSRLEERGFPQATILGYGGGVGHGGGKPGEVVKSLELSRWQGSHWAVVKEHVDAREMRFQGLKVVVLAEVSALGVDERRTFLAGSWGEARKKIIDDLGSVTK